MPLPYPTEGISFTCRKRPSLREDISYPKNCSFGDGDSAYRIGVFYKHSAHLGPRFVSKKEHAREIRTAFSETWSRNLEQQDSYRICLCPVGNTAAQTG
jgi:hypothetical protein